MNRVTGLFLIALCGSVLCLSLTFAWEAFSVIATGISTAVAHHGALSLLAASAFTTLCGAAVIQRWDAF